MARGAHRGALTVAGFLLAVTACGPPGPRPLQYGTERCAHCHMTLADPRFAGELVTSTGKVIPFDDTGCQAMFIATGGIAMDQVHSLWVNDFSRPDSMLDATQAVFLRNDAIRTPMDYGFVALRPGRAADSVRARLGGNLIPWPEVMRLVRERPGG